MTKVLRCGALALLILSTLAILPCAAADSLTVGDLLQRLADFKRLDAADPGEASNSLREAGYRLPPTINASDPLTEGRVVSVIRAMGLNVTTHRPDAPFGETRLEALLNLFEDDLADGGTKPPARTDGSGRPVAGNGEKNGPGFDPFTKGKGKGKGGVSPTLPRTR